MVPSFSFADTRVSGSCRCPDRGNLGRKWFMVSSCLESLTFGSSCQYVVEKLTPKTGWESYNAKRLFNILNDELTSKLVQSCNALINSLTNYQWIDWISIRKNSCKNRFVLITIVVILMKSTNDKPHGNSTALTRCSKWYFHFLFFCFMWCIPFQLFLLNFIAFHESWFRTWDISVRPVPRRASLMKY